MENQRANNIFSAETDNVGLVGNGMTLVYSNLRGYFCAMIIMTVRTHGQQGSY